MITRSFTNFIIKAYKETDTNKNKTPETPGLYLYALLSHQTLSVIAPRG